MPTISDPKKAEVLMKPSIVDQFKEKIHSGEFGLIDAEELSKLSKNKKAKKSKSEVIGGKKEEMMN